MAAKIILNQHQVDRIVSLYVTDGYSAEQVARIEGFSAGFIQDTLKANNIKLRNLSDARNRIKGWNVSFFDQIDTEEKAYYLGLLYADGCVSSKGNSVTIKLIEQDQSILAKMSMLIFNCYRLNYVDSSKYEYSGNANNLYQIKFSNPHFRERLIEIGCTPVKSLTLEFPPTMTHSTLVRHFIRGYYDGDGGISMDKDTSNYVAYILSTSKFCSEVEKIVSRHMDIHFSHYTHSNGITKTISIGGNRQIEVFLDWIYEDATLYIERKYAKYLEMKERIRDVDQRHGNKYAKCIKRLD